MEQWLEDFRRTIDTASPQLLKLSEEKAGQPRAEDHWSSKQILGHLIDSASNNHQRFVRAQFTSDLNFPGYEQDSWVESQQYETEPWENLVQLWASYNRHLVHLLSVIPEEPLTRSRSNHNLDKIAFKPVPSSEPTTLEYFARDYVDHLRHHLVQIFSEERIH